jgi:hypothetical protein
VRLSCQWSWDEVHQSKVLCIISDHRNSFDVPERLISTTSMLNHGLPAVLFGIPSDPDLGAE